MLITPESGESIWMASHWPGSGEMGSWIDVNVILPPGADVPTACRAPRTRMPLSPPSNLTIVPGATVRVLPAGTVTVHETTCTIPGAHVSPPVDEPQCPPSSITSATPSLGTPLQFPASVFCRSTGKCLDTNAELFAELITASSASSQPMTVSAIPGQRGVSKLHSWCTAAIAQLLSRAASN